MRQLSQSTTNDKHEWFLHYRGRSVHDGGQIDFFDHHRKLYEYKRFAEWLAPLVEEGSIECHGDEDNPGDVWRIYFDGKGGFQKHRLVRREKVQNVWLDILFGWMATSGQCLFRKQIIEKVGGWDAKYIPIEDHHFWLKIARFGPAVLLPECVHKFRVHGGQWRLAQTWKLATKMRRKSAERASGEERRQAERILQARVEFRNAMQYNAQGKIWKALPLFIKTARTAPYILQSPLARARFLGPFGRCFVGGKPGYEKLIKITRKRRSDFSLQQIVESNAQLDKTRMKKNEAVEDFSAQRSQPQTEKI
ncbi:MAG: glycosyltransferase family 2 protein, partial [bacterium]